MPPTELAAISLGQPSLDQLCGKTDPPDHYEESDCRCVRCGEDRTCAAEARLDYLRENA